MSSLLELEKEFFEFSGQNYISLGGFAPILESCVLGMEKRDWILTGPRGRISSLLRGASFQHLLDNPNGSKNYKTAPSSKSSADRALHAVGLAISSKRPVLCVLGVSALGQGSFFEALNIVAQQSLPVLFVLVTMDLSQAPLAKQLSCSPLSLAKNFGIETKSIAANPDKIKKLITYYRTQNKPVCIEIQLEK
jgi:TPP-dependent pyruvate/acetoin dehydrogenase alpha subunit